jgi:hypothetical protein
LITLKAAADLVCHQEKTMISKTKLGAIAFIAGIALSVAAPAFAQSIYSQRATGGGSAGYNHQVATDYRLKPHHTVKHTPKQQVPSKSQ